MQSCTKKQLSCKRQEPVPVIPTPAAGPCCQHTLPTSSFHKSAPQNGAQSTSNQSPCLFFFLKQHQLLPSRGQIKSVLMERLSVCFLAALGEEMFCCLRPAVFPWWNACISTRWHGTVTEIRVRIVDKSPPLLTVGSVQREHLAQSWQGAPGERGCWQKWSYPLMAARQR